MPTVAIVGKEVPLGLKEGLDSVDWLLPLPSTVEEIDAIVFTDFPPIEDSTHAIWEGIKSHRSRFPHVPIVLYGQEHISDTSRLEAFKNGADEVLHAEMPSAEQAMRLSRLVDDEVAARQLRTQAQMANEVAMQAMSNSSDLGETIQFFLDSQECDNFDLLGMRFFQSVQHFGLSCSLQMRSAFETKNMEANGLARELESELLWKLRDDGRYIDFGRRTVMNYQQVSLLVRNMPDNDTPDYGRIKDMMFSLLQALNARLETIDLLHKTEMQTKLLRQLVYVFSQRANQLNESVYALVSQGAGKMSALADAVEVGIASIDMNEPQETWLLGEIKGSEAEMNELLSRALKSNESFSRYVGLINDALEKAKDTAKLQSLLQNLLDNGVE